MVDCFDGSFSSEFAGNNVVVGHFVVSGVVGPEDAVDGIHADGFVVEVDLFASFKGVAVAIALVDYKTFEAVGVF